MLFFSYMCANSLSRLHNIIVLDSLCVINSLTYVTVEVLYVKGLLVRCIHFIFNFKCLISDDSWTLILQKFLKNTFLLKCLIWSVNYSTFILTFAWTPCFFLTSRVLLRSFSQDSRTKLPRGKTPSRLLLRQKLKVFSKKSQKRAVFLEYKHIYKGKRISPDFSL